MDGLGGLKQAAELFIQVRRGLEALNRGFEKEAGERTSGRLGREQRSMATNVRSHGFRLGSLSRKARRVCGNANSIKCNWRAAPKTVVKASALNKRGIRKRTGQRELHGPCSEIGTGR